MDYRELTKKYWEGETTLDEEKQLREWAKQENADPQLRALFGYFEQVKKEELPTDFDYTLKKISAPQNKQTWFNALRIAAGVLVVAALGWFLVNPLKIKGKEDMVDTYSDPKVAFEEVKKSLQLISSNFQQAKEKASSIKLLNDAENKIRNHKN